MFIVILSVTAIAVVLLQTFVGIVMVIAMPPFLQEPSYSKNLAMMVFEQYFLLYFL